MGGALASLDFSLRGFSHPQMTRALYWDICQSHHLAPLIQHLNDDSLVSEMSSHLEYFSSSILPQLKFLRHQPIFNDFNPDNVIVGHKEDDVIRGVIDFGDMVYGPLIADVAVAATYVLFAAGEDLVRFNLFLFLSFSFSLSLSLSLSFSFISLFHISSHRHTQDQMVSCLADFLRGYSSVLTLEEQEMSLLLPLVSMRLLITILITSWRASLYPENTSYILRWRAHSLRKFHVVKGFLTSECVRERLLAAARCPYQTHHTDSGKEIDG